MFFGRSAVLVFGIAIFSSSGVAQKIDASFVAGTTFTSDATERVAGTCLTPCSLMENFSTGHGGFFAATGAFRLVNSKAASLHLEAPVAVMPSTSVTRTNVFGTQFPGSEKLSALFITPSLRLKFAPDAPLSPFVSVGGGWARYEFSSVQAIDKAALQAGGGVDIKSRLPWLAFRAEARDFVTGQPDFGSATLEPPGSRLVKSRRHNVLAGGGAMLRF